jgi:hypothetical protein
MAVGHEGWILRSSDGGWSWSEARLRREERRAADGRGAAAFRGRWVAGRAPSGARCSLKTIKAGPGQPLHLPEAGVEDKHLNRIVGDARMGSAG